MQNNTQYGGIGILPEWAGVSPEDVLTEFIEHCQKVKILTDSSISCVTYLFYDLEPGFESPYVSMRSNNLYQPVKQILLKIGVSAVHQTAIRYERAIKKDRDPYGWEIECSSQTSFMEEVNTQNNIFRQSFEDPTSLFEPICPAIITYAFGVADEFKLKIFRNITDKIIERTHDIPAHYDKTDKQATVNLHDVYNATHKMTLIVMEFMEGYKPLSSFVRTHPQINEFVSMFFYELHRLAKYGYIHNDAHGGNVMIHPTYSYFSANSGRALIIDFGRMLRGHDTSYYKGYVFNLAEIAEFDAKRNSMNTNFVRSLTNEKKNVYLNAVLKRNIEFGKMSPEYKFSRSSAGLAPTYPISKTFAKKFADALKLAELTRKKELEKEREREREKEREREREKDREREREREKDREREREKEREREREKEITVKHSDAPETENIAIKIFINLAGYFPSLSPVYNFNILDWFNIFGSFDIFEDMSKWSDIHKKQTPIEQKRAAEAERERERKRAAEAERERQRAAEAERERERERQRAAEAERERERERKRAEKDIHVRSAVAKYDNDCKSRSVVEIPKCFKNNPDYRRWTLWLHPDKNPGCKEEATTKFQKLQENKEKQGDVSYNECLKQNKTKHISLPKAPSPPKAPTPKKASSPLKSPTPKKASSPLKSPTPKKASSPLKSPTPQRVPTPSTRHSKSNAPSHVEQQELREYVRTVETTFVNDHLSRVGPVKNIEILETIRRRKGNIRFAKMEQRRKEKTRVSNLKKQRSQVKSRREKYIMSKRNIHEQENDDAMDVVSTPKNSMDDMDVVSEEEEKLMVFLQEYKKTTAEVASEIENKLNFMYNLVLETCSVAHQFYQMGRNEQLPQFVNFLQTRRELYLQCETIIKSDISLFRENLRQCLHIHGVASEVGVEIIINGYVEGLFVQKMSKIEDLVKKYFILETAINRKYMGPQDEDYYGNVVQFNAWFSGLDNPMYGGGNTPKYISLFPHFQHVSNTKLLEYTDQSRPMTVKPISNEQFSQNLQNVLATPKRLFVRRSVRNTVQMNRKTRRSSRKQL